MKNAWVILGIVISFSHFSCGNATKDKLNTKMTKVETSNAQLETITFGAGCFWCVEAVYQRVKGVQKVVSGYMGGKMKNPSYRDVCTG